MTEDTHTHPKKKARKLKQAACSGQAAIPELQELSQEDHKTLSQKAKHQKHYNNPQRLRQFKNLMQINYQAGSTTEIFFSRQGVCVGGGLISPCTVRPRDGSQVVKFA